MKYYNNKLQYYVSNSIDSLFNDETPTSNSERDILMDIIWQSIWCEWISIYWNLLQIKTFSNTQWVHFVEPLAPGHCCHRDG